MDALLWIVRCLRFRVAVGEYDPHVAGSASSTAGLVVAASSRLGALVAELRKVGASCGLASAHEAARVANAHEDGAVARAQSKAPSALVGAKLSVERQAAVDAIAAAKCDASRHSICIYVYVYMPVHMRAVTRPCVQFPQCICMRHARSPSRQALAMATPK